MPRAVVIRLLQQSELFYAYQDTFLIMEAVLCGCPVVLLPSGTFKERQTLEDIGANVVAWGNDPVRVKTAHATVGSGREDYFKAVAAFWTQFGRFIQDAQDKPSSDRPP
jgi:hypothetical protein